jgi:hypothetical protein
MWALRGLGDGDSSARMCCGRARAGMLEASERGPCAAKRRGHRLGTFRPGRGVAEGEAVGPSEAEGRASVYGQGLAGKERVRRRAQGVVRGTVWAPQSAGWGSGAVSAKT